MRIFFLGLTILLSSFFTAQGQSSLNFTTDDVSYRDGVELLNQGKYLAASKSFENYLVVGDDPLKIADSRYFIAFCALQIQNDDGEALVESFVADYPNHPKATLAYYELGNLRYSEKSYGGAIKYFEKVYFYDLGKELQYDAKFKLGYSYFTQKEFDKAYAMFSDIKREENKYQYPASYYAGYLNFEKKEYDRAFYDFTRAEQNAAYAPVIPSLLVKVYYKQKRYDELIAYGNSALNKKNIQDKAAINLYIGEAYFQKHDFAQASNYYNAYLEGTKGNADRDLLFRIAYVQMISNEKEEAVEGFKKVALKNDTLGYISSYYLGNLYTQMDNKNFAISAFKIAKDNSYDPALEEEALFQYAKLNLDVENFDEAIISINDYKAKYPASDRVENIDEILTEAYLNSKNYDKALKHIESMRNRSARINRAYQQIAFFRGTEYFNNGDFYQSVQLFDKSLEQPIVPKFVIKANYWKGEAYSIALKYEEAVQAYSGVFRADAAMNSAEYLPTRYGIGYAYYNLKEYSKALGHFKYYMENAKTGDNQSKYFDAMVRLGDCYYAMKDYQRSLSTLDAAIQLNPRQSDYCYFRKGMVYGILGDIESANKSFDAVLNNYPNSKNIDKALFQKAQFNFEKGSYTYSIDLFTQIIKNYPESSYVPYALQSRAIAYSNLGNNGAAEMDYKMILGKYPTHEIANNALLGLQETVQKTGNTNDFDEYLSSFKKANPESNQLESIEFEAAKSLYFNQQYDKSIIALERFMKSYPSSAFVTEAIYLTADALYRIHDTHKALENYYKIIGNTTFNRYIRVVQRISELEFELENYQKSMDYFSQLERISSTEKDRLTAWAGLMETNFHTKNYQKSIDYGKRILDGGQVAINSKNEALLLLAKSYLALGDKKQGREYLDKTVANAKDENGAEALYLTAQLLFENKLYQESIDQLFLLNSNFSMYEFWLGKSFLLIADNYLEMGEDFQAKATLESVVGNSPIEEIVDQAELKLLILEEKAAAMEKTEADTLEIEDVEIK